MRILAAVALMVVAGFAATPAHAQSIGAAATPDWARPLWATDIDAANGGRATVAASGADVAVRVTIAPILGGVARVIRYEANDGEATLYLRRLTGHPTSGWWLWGPDTPATLEIPEAVQEEIAALARGASGLGRTAGDSGMLCPAGERIYVEIFQGGAPVTASRGCVADDPVSALARRLSDLAGSRSEQELAEAAVAELLAADQAFAAAAQEDGLGPAFAAFADYDAQSFVRGQPTIVGPEAIGAYYAGLPRGTRITWTPLGATVSSRGDLGYTWGESRYIAPGQPPLAGRYMTVWRRDLDGAWKFVADMGVTDPAPAPAAPPRPQPTRPQ